MSKRYAWWYKIGMLLLALVLIVPVLAACDDDDDDDTPTGTADTTTQPAGTTTTPTSTASKTPIKIAAVYPTTGYGAGAAFLAASVIDLVNWQVEKQGGIKVGDVYRPLDIISYDMKSDVAGATQAAIKAITQDNVHALTMGGLTGADGVAIADVADPENVLYVHYMGDAALNEDYTNTVNATLSEESNITDPSRFVLEEIKPMTAAYFAQNSSQERAITDAQETILQAAGVETVFKEYYPAGTVDFTTFLTKMRFEEPDVVMCWSTMQGFQAIHQQIDEVGGWGDIVFFGTSQSASGANVLQWPAANDTYATAYWLPGLDTPGSQEFMADWAAYADEHPDWAQKYGTVPTVNNVPFYQCLWLAIKAIETAGTDDQAAITAAARSGDVVWEAPAGSLRVDSDGYNGERPIIVRIEDLKPVIVKWYQE